jgi:acyl carrier protein
MEDRIKQVMAAVFAIKTEEINDDFATETSDEWDSLRHIHLISALEEEFDIEFDEEEIVEAISYPLVKVIVAEKVSA